MKKINETDNIEMISAFLFVVVGSLILLHSNYINISHMLFWSLVFYVIAFFQYISVKFKYDFVVLRACMAWVSGIVWTCFIFAPLNILICSLIFVLGIFNLLKFVTLTNNISFDLFQFFQEK